MTASQDSSEDPDVESTGHAVDALTSGTARSVVTDEDQRTPPPSNQTELVMAATRDFTRRHERRRRQAPRAILVGILAGLTAVAFRLSLNGVAALRNRMFDFSHAHTWGAIIPFLWCASGASAAVWLVRRFAPETSGSGIPHVEAVLYGKRRMRFKRVLSVKFIGGLLGIGGGLALGREGPTVQMGAAVGQAVGENLSATPRENQALIAAGAAAGLAAAFNAPLAGVVFVLEELQRDFAPGVFTPSFLAAVCSDVVTRLATGQAPVYSVFVAAFPPLSALPGYCMVGIFAGLVGVLFNRGLLGSLRFFERLSRWPAGLPAAGVGAMLGLVGWYAPNWLGDGHLLIEETLHQPSPLHLLVMLFAVRYVMTMLSYGCGAPGGIFAPLLVLGAAVGRLVGQVSALWVPLWGNHLPSFCAVGMAALFTAIVRAPLTGTVLIIEMTGHYDLMLPLLAASLFAYMVPELFHNSPIYEALLERDLIRSDETVDIGETLLVELQLHRGAPFDGKRVRDLGLPHGCLLVTLRRGMREIVPDANTHLEGGDQVSVVVDRSAVTAVELLRRGFQS